MWRGLVDTRGIEDPKLFTWPGRGVFAVFNRKPRAARPVPPQAQQQLFPGLGAYGDEGDDDAGDGDEGVCPMSQPWLRQWVVALQPVAGAGEWALPAPVALNVTVPGFYDAQVSRGEIIKEKNWMPLVYQRGGEDKLFMVHSIHPQHRVFEVAPDGSTTGQLLSKWPAQAAALLEGRDVHGGPPVVYVPGELLAAAGVGLGAAAVAAAGAGAGAGGEGRRVMGGGKGGYYLGVLHYFTMNSTSSRSRSRSRSVKVGGSVKGMEAGRVKKGVQALLVTRWWVLSSGWLR